MAKKYKLTESQLKNVIKESVNNIISEMEWPTWANASKASEEWRQKNPYKYDRNRGGDFDAKAREEFAKKHNLGGIDDKKGSIYIAPYTTRDKVTLSARRDHDFGDENPHNLNHNTYYLRPDSMSKTGFSRGRMWDYAHDTTPEEFFGDEEMGKKYREALKDVNDYNNGKLHYVKGKGWVKESVGDLDSGNSVDYMENGNEVVEEDVDELKLPDGFKNKAKKAALGAAAIGGIYGATAMDPGHGHPDAGADYNQPDYQEKLYQQKNHNTEIPIDSLDWDDATRIAMGESVKRNVKKVLREFDAKMRGKYQWNHFDPVGELDSAFNNTYAELGSNELSPKFFDTVKQFGCRIGVLAASNRSCLVNYHGSKFHVYFDFNEDKFVVER